MNEIFNLVGAERSMKDLYSCLNHVLLILNQSQKEVSVTVTLVRNKWYLNL